MMFNPFKKKKPKTVLSAFYDAMYGPNAKPGHADLEKSVEYTFHLLGGILPKHEIIAIAQSLHDENSPASTEDLALSTALNFFRREELKGDLFFAQLQARMQMVEWVKAGRANQMLGRAFANYLYENFKPGKI